MIMDSARAAVLLLNLTSVTALHRAGSTTVLRAGSTTRRRLLAAPLPLLLPLAAAAPLPLLLPLAAAAEVPKLGRFAPLSGAASFIGAWTLDATADGAKFSGALDFAANGDARLRGRTCAAVCEDVLLGESASAWKYANKNDVVSVSWTLDLATVYDDVLIFDGALDDDGSLRGTVYTGDAEIGARGAGKRKRVGAFVARR